MDFTEDYFHLKKNQSTRPPKLFFSPTRICCARVLVSLVCGCQQTQRRWDKGSYLFSPSSAVWWCLKTFSWGLLWPFCTLIKKEPRTREHCMSKKPSTHVCVCGGGAAGVPLAWSLSSWLATFFHSSIFNSRGVMRLSERELWQRMWNVNLSMMFSRLQLKLSLKKLTYNFNNHHAIMTLYITHVSVKYKLIVCAISAFITK